MGATASHVVGLVNVDNKGLAGVEKFIDDNPQLAMTGRRPWALRLSLDLGVQHVLREELGRAIATYRAKAAAGIVIDVHWGEVMALASLPDYDPNHREQALDKERLNRIGFGVYEMGSVFKVFTVAGVLDGGSATLRSNYDASSPIHYASFTIEDFHGKKRRLSVPESLHLFVEYRLGQDGARHGRRTSPRLSQEARPDGPRHHRAWRQRRADHPAALAETEQHDDRVRSRPLGDAAPACERGASPRQWRHRRDADLPAALARRRHARRQARAESRHERGDVEADAPQRAQGNGEARRVEGYRVGGKTGTAEKVVGGRYSTSALLTSFLAAFPTDAPEYLVLVMLDEPQRVAESGNQATAGVNAAPTAGKIIARIAPILGVPPKLKPEQGKFDAKVLASY